MCEAANVPQEIYKKIKFSSYQYKVLIPFLNFNRSILTL